MQQKNKKEHQEINSKKIMKYILLLLTLCFFSCGNDIDKETVTNYYMATNRGKIVSYQKIDYNYSIDSIVENITILNLKGELIQKQKNKFVKTDNGLDIIINGKRQPYLKIADKNQCTTYNHPIGHSIKNCFLERVDYKGKKGVLKYSYDEEVVDGISMTIYLNSDYSLIDKMEIVGSGSYNELIKVEKNLIPKEVGSSSNW